MLATLLFQKPDRIPIVPGEGRRSTLERWHREGLPVEVEDVTAFAYQSCGGKELLPAGGEGFPVDFKMIPRFEEKVMTRLERTQIVQDWKGNVCEIGSEYSPEYLREPIDFVTRRWIKCPVESREDWRNMMGRYDPDEQTRFPEDTEGASRRLKNRDWFVALKGIPGPFWQLREWLGFENLCMMFHDDPSFVAEMIAFWDDFIFRLLENVLGFWNGDCQRS